MVRIDSFQQRACELPAMRTRASVCTLLALVLLTGCLSPDPKGKQIADASPNAVSAEPQNRAPVQIDSLILQTRSFGESPMWADEVEAGRLPPVSDRLPEQPRFLRPFKQIGLYGGAIRRAITGDIVQIPATMKAKNEGLLTFTPPLGSGIEPNLAQRWEFQKGGRVLLLYLRKGIRWSDGHPFTADDVLFFYQDVLFDDESRPLDRASIPPALTVDNHPIGIEKIDDYTVRFFADQPMGQLLKALAGVNEAAYPRHVFAKWHPRYNKKATYEEFRKHATRAQFLYTPGMPTLSAWAPEEWIHGQRVVYKRNPYYWKVDTAGNQLPYADELVLQVIPDQQVVLLKFINGELDLFGRYSQIAMFETLKQAEQESGIFKVYLSGPVPAQAFFLNWDTPKLELRKAFRNRDVRIAMSLALNREEISQLLYHGFLVPGGFSFYPPNPYSNEESFRRFSEYDPDRAREMLDQAGYRDADGDGYRELADGSPFELTLDVATSSGGSADISELVTAHWQAVGIKVNTFAALRDIIVPRRYSGEFDVHYWWFDSADDPLSALDEWAITAHNMPYWHRDATTDGPDWLREASRLVQMAATSTDTVEIGKFMTRARDLYTENIPAIPLGAAYRVWGANTRLGNIPDDVSFSEAHGAWGRPLTHEQIFIKRIEP
jgi:peptide/nickel transport system substrate-binding protein